MPLIRLDECPASIVNYYDQASSDQRVKRVSANLNREGNESYTISHTFGRDKWEFVDHEWRITKSL